MADIYRGETLYGLTDDVAIILDRLGEPVAAADIIDSQVVATWHHFTPRPQGASS